MATTLHILGWKVEGLRCPDHEIDFCAGRDRPFPVSLIQMPNGTGKTTTLELLRAALSGSLDGIQNSAAVEEFRKPGTGNERGEFALRLELDARPLTLILEFDFEIGRVDYKTTWRDGQEHGFRPPQQLRRFLNKTFVNFFVFDGELADDLLDSKKTDARKAIESLFQVDLLDRMRQSVENYWERRTENETAKGQTGLTQSLNRFQKWAARLDLLKRSKDAFERELSDVEDQLKRREAKYEEEINKEKVRAKRISEARQLVEKLKNGVAETTRSVLDNMREPQALSPVFARALMDLKSGLDRVKLPESAAREWFEELADEDECVCGRPIGEDVRVIIRERATNYLGSDDVILLNRIKSDISEAAGASASGPSEELSKRLRELAEQSRQLQDAENDFVLLQREAEEDEAVKAMRFEIERLKEQRDKIREELRKYEDGGDRIPADKLKSMDPEGVFSIRVAETAKAVFQQEVERREEIRKLTRRRDVLARILKRAYAEAKQEIAEEIRDKTNERVDRLMPNNDIRVDRIDGALLLQGRPSGSAGENLSVGYAFLATLFDRSGEHHLPFVVDSPVIPIDRDIRAPIGNLLPRLAGQVIAFIISTERDVFLPSLKAASGGGVQYVTLFRKGATRPDEWATAVPGAVETADGFCVSGEDFFIEFQGEDEDG